MWQDPQVWELIAGGNARAVHHIESPAMVSLCKMCNVRDIDTLIAIVSVIRPGAANESKKMEFARRYQALSPVRYPHPSLEACLRSTYGLVVYEEHILQICEAFAGHPQLEANVAAMFEAFGMGAKLVREACWVNETVFWRPSKEDRSRIERTGRVQDTEDGLSEFPHVIVNQARMQRYLLDYMRNSPTRLEPNYGVEFVRLEVGQEPCLTQVLGDNLRAGGEARLDGGRDT